MYPMKTRKERVKVIHELFDRLRKDILIKNEIQLMRLEMSEDMEKSASEKNTEEEADRIRKFVEKHFSRVYELKSVGKRFVVKNGKIVSTSVLK